MIAKLTPEKLAELQHDAYERYASRDLHCQPVQWAHIGGEHRTRLVAAAADVLQELVIVEADPEPENVGHRQVIIANDGKSVRFELVKAMRWFIMPREQAINFAITILQHCGVPVEARIEPIVPSEPA